SGIDGLITACDAGRITVVASTIVQIEVLDFFLNEEHKERFRGFLNRDNVGVASVDRHTAELAHEIRSYYAATPPTVSTPDAIHLATAIAYNCEHFYTLDGTGTKKAGRKKDLKLLLIQGKICGKYRLNITVPRADQLVIAATPDEESEIDEEET
ncbi:MAG: PIN domain-containing protein, partial [bacterium]